MQDTANMKNSRAVMIAMFVVAEAIYDDYAKVKFPNYDQRREDLQPKG